MTAKNHNHIHANFGRIDTLSKSLVSLFVMNFENYGRIDTLSFL